MAANIPSRLPSSVRISVKISAAILWLTGCGWLVAHFFFQQPNEFGIGPSAWEAPLLRVHGIAAVIGVFLFGWLVSLQGEALVGGDAEGRIVGGCLTLLEATIGTPWELDTRDAILVLEDRAMKPYQVDRVLMHLKQAGKLDGVRGIVLGEFPDCEATVGSPTVRDVCLRILGELRVPVVFGSAVGHTKRPMLTLPLGVRGRLSAKDAGEIEILEAAVVE